MPDHKKERELLMAMGKLRKMMASTHITKGMNKGEFFTLSMIGEYTNWENEFNSDVAGVTVSKLSQLMDITKPAISQMLNVLEKKQLIQRDASLFDRRVVFVSLTPEGEQLLKDMRHHMHQVTRKIVDKLGDDDTATLIRIIGDVYELLKEEAEENN